MDDVDALKARIRELEARVQQTDEDVRLVARTFSISRSMARLLTLLRTSAVVTPTMMAERIGTGTELRVAAHRLRGCMAKYGIMIQNQYAVGYWLDVADKEKIAHLIRVAVGGPEFDGAPPAAQPPVEPDTETDSDEEMA